MFRLGPRPPKTAVPAKRAKARPAKRHKAGRPLDSAPWLDLAVLLTLWPRDRDGLNTNALAGLEKGRGRHARSPGQIPAAGWVDVLSRTARAVMSDNIAMVAGSVAFSGVMALFPALAAFVSLYGLFGDVAAAQKDLAVLTGVLPADTLTFIGEEMVRIAAAKHASLSATFIGALVLSIWSANAGMKALVTGLNLAYGQTETRSFVRVNLLTLTFTVGALLFLLVSTAAVLVLPPILHGLWLDSQSRLLAVLRWPALWLISLLALAMVYRFGPCREPAKWRWVTWGGAAASALWLGGSLLLSWYVAGIGRYSITYGSLGAVFGFLTWLWLTALIALLGAELNAELEHQTLEDSTTGAPLPRGLRGAAMADTIGRAAGGFLGRIGRR